MLPQVKAKRSVAIVGAGNLGSALAFSLAEAGYRLTDIVSRPNSSSKRRAKLLARRLRAHVSTIDAPEMTADIFWLCVPDTQIRACADRLAAQGRWTGKVVYHSSGALSGDELGALRRKGAAVASVHPMMTFVSGVTPSLTGVPFALEGDRGAVRWAQHIVRDLGGVPFLLPKNCKAAYHAWGAFASPLLVALLVTAEEVARAAGIDARSARKKMLPIVRQSIANYAERGAAAAFSGPIRRGDAETVAKHLKVLGKTAGAKEVYLALARSALRRLPSRNPAAVKKVIG